MLPGPVLFFLLIIYLITLGFGAKVIVDNSVILARRMGVSDLFIGLTLIAFGTDLPELFVAIVGALNNLQGQESSGVIIGNAIGSSVCQISLVIGVTALFHYLTIGKQQIKKLGIELFSSCLLLFLVGFDGRVSQTEGIILMVAFSLYLFSLFFIKDSHHEKEPIPKSNLFQQIFNLVAGFAVVIFFSEQVIDSAIYLAKIWDIEQSFVGAVIIGLGTSLPEMVISVSAILQKKSQLSIGNIIGSNIFDLLIPVGIAATISPLNFNQHDLWFDLPFLLIVSILVIWFLLRVKGLQKGEGITLIVAYLVYVSVKFLLS